MQRRFTIALAMTALSSVLLVGFGILLLANAGARRSAERQVEERLEALTDLAAGDRSVRDFRRVLFTSQTAFGFETLQIITIDDDGRILPLPEGNRRPRPEGSLDPVFESDVDSRLDDTELAEFDQGQTVLIGDGGTVVGVRQVDVRFRDSGGTEAVRLALAARQPVSALPRGLFNWFLLSSLVVLGASILVATWLARRFAAPIRSMQQTTAAIAAGDLSARADVDGSDEVADLGRSVNTMASELERSKALDQQFLMSVSHDLRTPLTAISGYAEALADGTASDGKTVGPIIVGQARRLERLVQDLLDLARLDANQFQLNLQPVDLAVVAGRTTAEFEPKAAEHDVTLSFVGGQPAAAMVEGDPDRLAQAVGNLIDNGLKFASDQVTVTADVDTERGLAVVSVADDGPGIADDDLPFIFDRLYSGKAKPRRAESSIGLGLTIVRELITAMGGHVDVTSEPSAGTRFRVELPLAATWDADGTQTRVDA